MGRQLESISKMFLCLSNIFYTTLFLYLFEDLSSLTFCVISLRFSAIESHNMKYTQQNAIM